MPEHGREYWERHQVDRRLSPGQLVEIAQGHLEREDALVMEARRVLLVDTSALTTAVFARQYHGAVDPRLAAIADASPGRYDVAFLCEDDFPYRESWDRSGPQSRALMQRMVVEDLADRGLDAVRLRGPLESRVRQAAETLARHPRWNAT